MVENINPTPDNIPEQKSISEIVPQNYNSPVSLEIFSQKELTVVSGGFNREIPELRAMRENPSIMIYELLQNLSYGLGHEPPPVVLLCMENGSRLAFTGADADWPQDKIIGIQFITNNPNGITTSDAVINRHDATKSDQPLGFWGRGLKNAAVYGLDTFRDHQNGQGEFAIQIDSTFEYGHGSGRRCNWSGVYRLDPSSDEKFEQLNMHWFERDDDQNQTIVTLHHPPQEILDALKHSPDTFLYVNPKYRGGVFVPAPESSHPNAGVAHQFEARGMYLSILDDDVVSNSEVPLRKVYVDGIKADTGYSQTLFPWHIEGGLAQAERADWIERNNFIYRSQDSARASNLNILSGLIMTAAADGQLGEDFWYATFTRLLEHDFTTTIGHQDQSDLIPKHSIIEFWYRGSPLVLPESAQQAMDRAWNRFLDEHPQISGVADTVSSEQKLQHHQLGLGQPYQVLECDGLLKLLQTQNISNVRSVEQIISERKKIRAEQIRPWEINTNIEVTEGLLDLSQAIQLLVDNEIKLSYENQRLSIVLSKEFCGRFFNPDHPELMFPHDEHVRQALITILYMNGQRTERIEAEYFDGGSSIAHLHLEVTPTHNRGLVMNVEGKARDTLEENPQNNLILSINTVDESDKLAQAIWQEYSDLAQDFATNETDLEKAQRQAANEQRVRRALEEELNLLKQNEDKLREQIEQEMQEELLRQTEANQQKLKAEIRKARNRYFRYAGVAAGTTLVTLGAREVEIPEIPIINDAKQTLWSIGGRLWGLNDGESLPTVAGDLVITNNRPNWGLTSDRLLLGNNRPVNIDEAQLRQALGEQLPGDRDIRQVNGDAGSMVLLETKQLGGNPGGFYLTAISNHIETNENNALVTTMETDTTTQSVEIPRGRPAEYQVRHHFLSTFPIDSWAPVTVRLGEKPVGYAGVESAEFRQNEYGVWEIKITANPEDNDLILYTDIMTESDLAASYLNRQPNEQDQASLVVFDLLRPDVKRALQRIKASDLSPLEKVDEALAVWRRLYLYDKDTYVNEDDFPINTSEEYITALINQGIGPCGYAATGAVALIREVGIPANIVGGFINGAFDTDLEAAELHAMATVWNQESQEWVYIEPQIGRSARSILVTTDQANSATGAVMVDIDTSQILRVNDASHAYALGHLSTRPPEYASEVILSEGVTTTLSAIPDLEDGAYINIDPDELATIQAQIIEAERLDKVLDSILPAVGVTTAYAVSDQILNWRRQQREQKQETSY